MIEAFKSTLEEAVYADLLVIVIDSASEEYQRHIQVVNGILNDIGAGGKPTIYLFNKIDQKPKNVVLPSYIPSADAVLETSAKAGVGLTRFIEVLSELLPGKKQRVCAVIPYDKGSVLSALHRGQTVLSEIYEDGGTRVEAFVDAQGYALLRDYLTK